MPSGFASLDTGFPDLSGYSSTEQKLQAMEDYLVQLLEQLRYTLHNLGVENLNAASVKELGNIITEPIRAEIDDPESGLSARIEANAAAISTEVTRATGAEGSLSSRITQTAEGLQSKVSNGAVISAINQSAEQVSIEASKVNLTGYITATDIGSTGATVIDGGRIQTGSISADRISGGALDADNVTLRESFLVQVKNDNGEYVNAGRIGADYDSSITSGYIWMESAENKNYVLCSDEDIRAEQRYGAGYRRVIMDKNGVEIYAGDGTNWARLSVKPDGVYIQKKGGSWQDVFSLF